MREPLILPLAAVATGICLSQFIVFSPAESITSVVLLFLLSLLAYYCASRWLTRLVIFLACTSAGLLVDVLQKTGPAPELDANPQEIVVLSGCVVDPTVFADDREHFILELAPHARVRVSLTLKPDEKAPIFRYGQKLEIEARVRRPRNFGNPGAFDYVRYMARQDIYWTASARANTPATLLPGRCGSRLLGAVFALRQSALEGIENLYGSNSYAIGMMEAILIGDSTRLEKVWTDHFRRTGTYHALVISGLHVTVLAGVLLFLLRVAMVNEILALAIAAVAAWIYAAVSGWSAPVIRAAGGFTLYLVGRYFHRRGRLLNLLAAIGIGYLIYDPGQLFEASFQLSFLSVAAIGAFAVPILEATSGLYRAAPLDLGDRGRDPRLPREAAALRVELRLLAETLALWTPVRERWWLGVFGYAFRLALWLYEMALVSFVVQVALALPMALYFHRLSVTGLSANLLIIPLLSAVVPVGFGAVFTGWHVPGWLALTLLRWSEAVADWHVRFEPSWRIPTPPVWLSILTVVMLVLAAVALRVKSQWRLPALFAVFVLFGVLFVSPFAPSLRARTLELTAIDVGQGDSLFVVFPEGRTMLVDAGGILAFGRRTKPRIDIGEDVVSQYLWTRRIRRVDVIAITHLHEDHIGGLAALLENFHPKELWTGATPDNERWKDLERHALSLGIRVVPLRAGDRREHIEVLAPLPDYEPGAAARNNDSLAMRISFGEHTFLLTGDMEKQVEYQLVAAGAVPRSNVLKVAHHGSKTSSTEEFLAAAHPDWAVISAGFENSFRHPHPDVLERLQQHRASILRTDLDGLVTVTSDGHRLTVERPMHTPLPLMPVFGALP